MSNPALILPDWQPTAPAAGTNPQLCRIYGKIVDLQGDPVPFQSIEFRVGTDAAGAVVAGQLQMASRALRIATNRQGYYQVDLPRGADILVRLPGVAQTYGFIVPDLDVAALMYLLFPFPISLDWVITDSADSDVITDIVPAGGPLVIPAGTATLGVASTFSDGTRCLVLSYSAEQTRTVPAASAEEVDVPEHYLELTGAAGETWTISSLIEEGLGCAQIWDKAGYTDAFEAFPPYFMPPQLHDLEDAEDLEVQFT